MECPRCFFSKSDTVDERFCKVCGRSYRPSVNVYLGLVTLFYLVFVRYLNYVLTGGSMFEMRIRPETGFLTPFLGCYLKSGLEGDCFLGWARWPVDVQMRPELVLVLGAMLGLMVLVPVVMSILYGKRGGFLLAAIALILGPSVEIGLVLFLCAWLAGGWKLRMQSKIASAVLGCVPAWLLYLIYSRPSGIVPLPAAYYTPALAAVAVDLVLIFALFVPLKLARWNARWAGLGLCVLVVAPIGGYKLLVGEDAIDYAILSRQLGLESRLFENVPGAQVVARLLDDIRKEEAEEKARLAQEGPRSKLYIEGLPSEEEENEQERLQAKLNLRKIEFAAELESRVAEQKQQVIAACRKYLDRHPSSRYEADVLYTMVRAMDMVVDTSALRGRDTSSLPVRYDASRIRSEESRGLCRELLQDHPDSPYTVVVLVKQADYEVRYGEIPAAIAKYAEIIAAYRDKVDARLPGTSNLSVFTNLFDVGERRRTERRQEFVDRQYRVAERTHAFLVENSNCPSCDNETLRQYMRIPLFEVPDIRRQKLQAMLEACPGCKLADNLAYDLALLETSVQQRLQALTAVTEKYAGSDGAAMALYELAEIRRKLEGNRFVNMRDAVALYRRLQQEYPESYLGRAAELRINEIERELEKALPVAPSPAGDRP